jgi:hypothetical protein
VGIKIQYVMEVTEFHEGTPGITAWGEGTRVLLGTGELDPNAIELDAQGLLLIRQVPDHLHEIADQLESAMTTGTEFPE